jgi:hypothetical protein
MSHRERRRRSRQRRTLCAACTDRKARFRHRGEVRADRDHTLCFECYRGELNRVRAQRLTADRHRPAGGPTALASWRDLDDRRRAHRQRMLDHLLRSKGRAVP